MTARWPNPSGAVNITDQAIVALVGIGQTPYGDYRSYDGATVADGLDAFRLAGLIQQALFPYLAPLPADDDLVGEDGLLVLDDDLNCQSELPDGTIDNDRYLTTGCGRLGTTSERDSRCASASPAASASCSSASRASSRVSTSPSRWLPRTRSGSRPERTRRTSCAPTASPTTRSRRSTSASATATTASTSAGPWRRPGFWTRGAEVGMFGRGIAVHPGTGDDSGTIDSVLGDAIADSPLQVLITTVYGNDGDDTITVDAPDVDEARLVVYGDDGDGTVDGTDATLELIVFGEDGNDDIQGGDDTIHGGLGQDSIVGGSTDLFGLVTPDMRPDGSDTVGGGNGDHSTRNDLAAGLDNARNADTIVGDNGNVFRIVTVGGGFEAFTYLVDVIPTVVVKLDYSPVGGAGYWLVADPADPATATWVVGTNMNIGGADTIQGESGNDTVHGMTGNDVLFGDAHDDDLYGGAGGDWISGGTGDDGIIGDEGCVMTARKGIAEPLHHLVATVQDSIAPNGYKLVTVIYATGDLRKSVELDLASGDAGFTTFRMGANDILYGGWGNDFRPCQRGRRHPVGCRGPGPGPRGTVYWDDPFAFLDAVYGDDQFDAGCDGCRDILQHGFRPGEFR